MKSLISAAIALIFITNAHAENVCNLTARLASTILIEHANIIAKLFTTESACTKKDGNLTELLTHEGSFSDPNYGKRLEQAIKNFETGKGKSGWIGMVLRELKSVSESEYHSLLEQMRTFGNKVKEMNSEELKLFKRQPFVAIWMDHNREKAELFCNGDGFKKQFKDIQESESYLGRIDACRHTFWNAMASRFGMSSFSEKFATAHEKGATDISPADKGSSTPGPNPPPGAGFGSISNNPTGKIKTKEIEIEQEIDHCPRVHSKKFWAIDHDMDIRNNEIGRKLGISSCDHGYNSKIIEKNVVLAIKMGKTMIMNCRLVGNLVISKLEPSNQYRVKPTQKLKILVPVIEGGGNPSGLPAQLGNTQPRTGKKDVY